MRVLSIPQPWAHLVMRGVKTFDVRTWYAKHTGGRIAIHASARPELKQVEKVWADDRRVAECFADQGWIDGGDLLALPRSALLGTVELRGVHRGRAVLAAKVNEAPHNWLEDALETAVRDPVTGHLRPGPAPARTLPVDVPLNGWVFGFSRALAVEPITGVAGQQHLWALPAALAAELSAREARSRSGNWVHPAPSVERVQLAREAWRERFETEERRYAIRLIKEAIDEEMVRSLPLEDEGAERMLQTEVRKLSQASRSRGPDGRPLLTVPKTLRALFDGASQVSATRFEAEVRFLMSRIRYDRDYAEMYAKLTEDTVTRLREGLAREEEGSVSRSAVEAEVKREYLREWKAAEQLLPPEDREVQLPDY